MDIMEYIQSTNFLRKLEAALENIRVGGGGAVFEGIQNGKCTVDITANSEYVFITAHAEHVTLLPPMQNDNIVVAESEHPIKADAAVAQVPDEQDDETLPTEPRGEPKRRKRY